ncbi:hypothetical protein [Ectopseudomonas mendocina]|uniref:Transmembrane protein n=1 Tax=Ectopseudomonas mendocina TaxID=300 RepID=A0ABD7RX65_ECTME|nr:hypothetical protein [Pseudomonas mendocina]AEB56066.1 hypothetical protein MDS_0035 [Pseudomonas mendocina NK-01]PKM33422.1 MAG: hypothetical protein CVV08_06890 [Gammaproteobacteria bacterium HGW-Gammaproteobacteria-12]TRO13561.1 hypothetical protein EQ829_12475 [Pseudomonas mendocina]TRO18675.1 hypothetical protein EQ836_09625 [Pseudomonas mendocina]
MQADLLLVAALLRRGRSLDHFSSALSLVAVAFGLAPWLGAPPSLMLALLCAALLVAGLAEKYWALRVALDAELFQRLAEFGDQLDSQTHALDQALQNLGLQNAQQADRSWSLRAQGALGLLRKQALCLLLQVTVVVLGIFIVFA